MSSRLVLSTLGLGAIAFADTDNYAWVGSGGCDNDMVGCVDDVTSERTSAQIVIEADGKLSNVDFPYYDESKALWLASSNAVGGLKCIFAALADTNEIRPLYDTVPGIPVPLPNAATAPGVAPVHMTVTADEKFLLVANYGGADNATTSKGAGVSSFAIPSDGLGCGLAMRDFVPHAGSGPDKSRQGGAHVHSVYAHRDGYAFVCDLGQDLIFTYSISEDGKLSEVSRVSTAPGSGPRHLAFHPTLSFLYSVQEMGKTVSVYEIGANGTLSLQQTMPLVQEGMDGSDSKAAELAILPDGSALYASNRGSLNTVTVFAVAADGSLTQTQQIEAPRFPRGMELAHNGTILLVASQEDSTVESFKIAANGTLSSTGYVLKDGIPNHPAAFAVFPGASSHSVVV